MTLSELIAIPTVASEAEDAVAAAVRDHAHFVFKVAYSVLRNCEDAEDAVQETFLRAMRHSRTFASVEDRRAWLARTVWRIAVDRIRLTRYVSIDDEAAWVELREAEARFALAADETGSAEALAISDQMLALLHSLITTLPSDLRDVITLSTVEEMNSQQIANVLEIPEGSVRTRLMRARELLREKFQAKMRARNRKSG